MQIVSFIKDSTVECAPFNWGLTLFSYGCNLHCKMCEGYNYEKVTDKNNIIGNAIDIIKENITPLHDTVVFLGGEPTIWGDKLMEALKYCKEKGLKTKIFTNGTKPDVVSKINNMKLCDAWSVDYKGLAENIGSEIGCNGNEYIKSLKTTLKNIINNSLPIEIRTTFYDKNSKDRGVLSKNCNDLVDGVKIIKGSDYYIKYITQEDVRGIV